MEGLTRSTPEQIKQMQEQSKGKVIESLEYDKEDDYYTFVFNDGSETSFRFMADLV